MSQAPTLPTIMNIKNHTTDKKTLSEQATMIIQQSKKPLSSNPFTTYRDPKTGKWQVVMKKTTNS